MTFLFDFPSTVWYEVDLFRFLNTSFQPAPGAIAPTFSWMFVDQHSDSAPGNSIVENPTNSMKKEPIWLLVCQIEWRKETFWWPWQITSCRNAFCRLLPVAKIPFASTSYLWWNSIKVGRSIFECTAASPILSTWEALIATLEALTLLNSNSSVAKKSLDPPRIETTML